MKFNLWGDFAPHSVYEAAFKADPREAIADLAEHVASVGMKEVYRGDYGYCGEIDASHEKIERFIHAFRDLFNSCNKLAHEKSGDASHNLFTFVERHSGEQVQFDIRLSDVPICKAYMN